MPTQYAVIVIGGGHAGAEAAWAAANLLPCEPARGDASASPTVALVTLDPSKIGVMSCNPAIGGLAKGQIVREIDALGGLMGLATDATGIQFKVLNSSKGAAVHGPRAQCDKHAYAQTVQQMIAARPEIEIVAGAVEQLIVERGHIRGVVVRSAAATASDEQKSITLRAQAVVLTTGTFMRGLMHTGESKTPGGRFGEDPAIGISGSLKELGFELGRLKTGTPPRLRRGSIDWDALEPQHGDERPVPFSDLTAMLEPTTATFLNAHAYPSLVAFPVLPQVACRVTATNAQIHAHIQANIHRAPMYSGQIESAGPRYCPSIEDKVVRFAQRDTHNVFLEPESHRDDWIYCNGISTSLPADVQDVIVRLLPGCGKAEILRYGYAVEYDMVRPHQISAGGMTKLVHGLFLAGQINGTSGYEEAAGQGLIAGINAARLAVGRDPITLGREQAYIGVMMDDLVTKTPVEPYRMFTSRAEHRLLLRSDNAADRLTPLAIELGLLDSTELGSLRKRVFAERQQLMAEYDAAVGRAKVDGMHLGDLIRRPEFEFDDMVRVLRGQHRVTGPARETGQSHTPPTSPERERAGLENAATTPLPYGRISCTLETTMAPAHEAALRSIYTNRVYAAYIIRQNAEIKRQADMERRPLPAWLDYRVFTDLRTEAREALTRFRPETYGQAGRLEGITPADLTLLAVLVKRHAPRTSEA